jgi:hypothetical protein
LPRAKSCADPQRLKEDLAEFGAIYDRRTVRLAAPPFMRSNA